MKFNVYWEYTEWYLMFAENMQEEFNVYWEYAE